MPVKPAPALPVLLVAGLAACGQARPAWPPPGLPTVTEQASGTDQLLQAVAVVGPELVWASGHGGTWTRTTDGGATWSAAVLPGGDSLQFRDIHAADARTAWLLAAGPGDLSRIYRTDDGGASWELQWTNPEPAGFFDCIDFWDRQRGIAYGDAVEGSLRILVTGDGGRTWRFVPDAALPGALPGEGGFAASGLCVDVEPDGHGWVGAGNTSASRVLHTDDYGRSWRATEVPLEAGEGAGTTAVAMVDARRGYAFGGVLHRPDDYTRNVTATDDGGATWRLLPGLSFPGPAYGGVVIPGTDGAGLVAVGPGGAALSTDGGDTWATLDDRAWWAVGSAGVDATWIAGPDGRLARLVW